MIEWVITSRIGSTSYITASIALSVYKTGQQNSHQLVLRFSKEAQHDLRLIEGDRLLLGFDETTKQICFKRTTQGGHKLSGKSKGTNVLSIAATVKNRGVVPSTRYEKNSLIIEATYASINAPEFFRKQEKAA